MGRKNNVTSLLPCKWGYSAENEVRKTIRKFFSKKDWYLSFRQTNTASTHCDSQFMLKEKCIFAYAIVRITDRFMVLFVSP